MHRKITDEVLVGVHSPFFTYFKFRLPWCVRLCSENIYSRFETACGTGWDRVARRRHYLFRVSPGYGMGEIYLTCSPWDGSSTVKREPIQLPRGDEAEQYSGGAGPDAIGQRVVNMSGKQSETPL